MNEKLVEAMKEKGFLTVKEAAARSYAAEKTIYAAIYAGKLKVRKVRGFVFVEEKSFTKWNEL